MTDCTLDDGVYRALVARIISRDLRPGERIVEAEIAEQLGVSRTPVRAALRTLMAQGLVLKWTNRGCAVVKHDPQDMCRMYEVREALEGMAARLMALRGEEPEVAALRESCGRLELGRRDAQPGDFAEQDLEFHQLLMRASGNRFIVNVSNAQALVLSTFLDYPFPFAEPWVMQFSHEEVLAAIEARDPEAAEAAMRRHVREPKERLEAWIRQGLFGEQEVALHLTG